MNRIGNIEHVDFLLNNYKAITKKFDFFFWGAWDGHMKLFRSSRRKIEGGYYVGKPFIKTVYCTYGYSVNKKTAAYLLEKTKKINYPVDQFKKTISSSDLLIGGIEPEVVTTIKTVSNIKDQAANKLLTTLFVKLLDIKNNIICSLR